MSQIQNDYEIQNNNTGYQKLKNSIPVLANWDDHDYGKNDAGEKWEMKKRVNNCFLIF